MKKLHFEYSMEINYAESVSTCSYTIKCLPQKNNRQIPDDINIKIYPPSNYSLGFDGLMNRQIYGKNTEDHTRFVYEVSGDVTVGLALYDEVENDDISMVFKHPHGLNIPGDKIKAYFNTLGVDDIKDDYRRALNVMYRFYEDFEYRPNTTNIYTTAEEAFAQGYGVCQDFAHIFIALMHLAKIPARYVTGFVTGEGASHAWVEVLCEGKWYGLDPTNNKPVFDEHIKIGIGRDANDCMINRGIMRGGGVHTPIIKVSVEEM